MGSRGGNLAVSVIPAQLLSPRTALETPFQSDNEAIIINFLLFLLTTMSTRTEEGLNTDVEHCLKSSTKPFLFFFPDVQKHAPQHRRLSVRKQADKVYSPSHPLSKACVLD